MAGGNADLSGPDLTGGVPESDLVEGQSLAGHADGEPVLLVRVGGEVLAVGAKCTHYGGPLSEGLVVGDTIRCPWHHACFSLRTGEALRPPALTDLPAWRVVRADGRIRVSGRAPVAAPRALPSRVPGSIVIVGAGPAGDAAALTLRREGYAGGIVVIDPDEASPCDRPNLSKDYLAGSAPEEWIPLHPPGFFADRDIERVAVQAASVDPGRRVVVLEGGREVAFRALVLATGAEPVRLPVPTDARAPLFHLRSLADSRAIIAASATGKQAVVIGASFIGLEVAASLRQRGIAVHVVAPEAVPLGRVMGPDLGAFVRRLHEDRGVVFHLGRTVRSLEQDHAVLDDGQRLDADLFVAGVGVRPRVQLAREAGLAVDDGIVVDEFLQTSSPGIFAAGDVARWPDPRSGRSVRIEHWVVAQRMGQTAARNALGARERYRAVPFFWSQHYDVTIACVGHAASWDEARLDGSPDAGDCSVTFFEGGRLMAVATLSRDQASLAAERTFERELASG